MFEFDAMLHALAKGAILCGLLWWLAPYSAHQMVARRHVKAVVRLVRSVSLSVFGILCAVSSTPAVDTMPPHLHDLIPPLRLIGLLGWVIVSIEVLYWLLASRHLVHVCVCWVMATPSMARKALFVSARTLRATTRRLAHQRA